MEKVRRRILPILLTLLILFSNSVVTFAYSQEVPEPFINVGTDNMSNQELEILIKDIRNSYLQEGKTIEQEFEKYKTQVFSSEEYPKQLKRLSDSDIVEMIEMIDIELSQEGTSIEQELQEFKVNLINNTNLSSTSINHNMTNRYAVSAATNDNNKVYFANPSYIDDLMADFKNYKSLYTNKKSGIQNSLENNILKEQFRDQTQSKAIVGNLISKAGIAAVVAYFNSQAYVLSAELMSHYGENRDPTSTYYPSNAGVLKKTVAFAELKTLGGYALGSGQFAGGNGGRYDMDAYYAINKYNYEKVGRKIIISDKYDYTEKASYKTIPGIAINFMYELERRGLAVPYYVNTTLYY